MERLIEAGLFGDGLVRVDTPALVERYNECLAEMGVEPTGLERFGVDGIGWSPEIANEKSDPRYLCHGAPNQMAVVITPDQGRKPIHYPARSFDRALMDRWFSLHRDAIADATADTGIWLDIDLGVTSYASPYDLLLVRDVTVRTHAGELAEAAVAQSDLIGRFLKGGNAWCDASLREEIRVNAKQYGDLRDRRFVVPDTRFEVNDFHTRAFGGVFVFRTVENGRALMIFEDAELARSLPPGPADVYALDQPELLDRLHAEGLIEIDLMWFARHPELLAERLDHLATELLCDADPDLDIARLSPARRKKRITRIPLGESRELFELERFARHLGGENGSTCALLSREVQRRLLHPAGQRTPATRSVVWKLLCRLRPMDPLSLYIHDKNLFFERYRTWPASKRRWATRLVRERYRPYGDR